MQKTRLFAITAILIERILFIVLFFSVRKAIFESISLNLKNAVSVVFCLLIAFISLGDLNSGSALIAIVEDYNLVYILLNNSF